MSLLNRTISAFPFGRTTSQIFALLDTEFDARKRAAILAELDQLSQDGAIYRTRSGLWRSVAVVAERAGAPASAVKRADEFGSDILRAAPAQFSTTEISEIDPGRGEALTSIDPAAVLRYYRSALRSDPRGAIEQTGDRHGVQWHLFAGAGPLTPEAGSSLVIKIELDHLSDAFRQALVRREANEQTLAIGWPLAVTTKGDVPVVLPVGLISASWARSATQLELLVEADDVLVNPQWIQGAARSAGWTASALQDAFVQAEGLGQTRDDFMARLREVAAGRIAKAVNGRHLAFELDLTQKSIFDAAALFLPTDSTFTAGAVKDLDQIAAWPTERLQRTSLASMLGLGCVPDANPLPALNIGPLNKEQIGAVDAALSAPLTVVTGPPGTGKSQAIVSMVASVLNAGGSVLVASKNHQALDAVEERLEDFAPKLPYLIRTLDPRRQIDLSFDGVLQQLVNAPPQSVLEPDRVAQSRVATLSAARRRSLQSIDSMASIQCEIADLVERLEARHVAGLIDTDTPQDLAPKGVWTRLVAMLRLLFVRRASASPAETPFVSDGASIAQLQARIDVLRKQVDALDLTTDPVALTAEITQLVRQILPRVLGARVNLREQERLRLGEAAANLELQHSNAPFPAALARDVISYRPLWLASVLGAPKRIPLDDAMFDLVIFDEASQCDIASALPLFARARRAVVVGDDRQLSFISQVGIAHDRNLMLAQGLPVSQMGRFAQSRRSLFDFANLTPGVEKVMLRDQYRSAAQIVGYINDQFYGGKLRVANNHSGLKAPSGTKPGIAWKDVPSPIRPMDRNVNEAEVHAIVSHLKTLLVDQSYSGSVGVIAPFRPQVAALTAAIERDQALTDALLKAAEFRAGTVDSFQGQERDLILFSPCLGASSAMSAVAFVQKDWRRLNVAISRARAVAHVFGDLSYARCGKVRSLQSLARFATEPRARVGETIFDSEWERRVYHALKAKGLDPLPQFEIAGRRLDFALFGAGDIKLDLEIDGRHWHTDIDGQRKTSDIWRDHQLKSMGWRVRRFWVDELQENLESCIERATRDLS